jgi:hypothetical protein
MTRPKPPHVWVVLRLDVPLSVHATRCRAKDATVDWIYPPARIVKYVRDEPRKKRGKR